MCPQCGALQNPVSGLVDKAKKVTVSSLLDKAKELFRFLRKHFIEFVKACRYKLIERKMDHYFDENYLRGGIDNRNLHRIYYGDHEKMKSRGAFSNFLKLDHYCNREHWNDGLDEDDEFYADSSDDTHYWEDCDDKLIDIIEESRGLKSWVEIMYELVKEAGDLSKTEIESYYFHHFLQFEYRYKAMMRGSNPNLTERKIDDLYILNVRDYESMNLPPLMDKAHLFDAPSKSFMEDFKKKWETLRNIKMEEKKKLRKSHPFLIEREIDDLYNIENKIHIDVYAFDPNPDLSRTLEGLKVKGTS